MEDPDASLALDARDGDAAAFGDLVSRHQALLAGMLHRFAASTADLEDMVQETFIKAWQALPGWQPDRPFLHWLKRIAVRTGLEYCCKRKRSPVDFLAEIPETETPYAADSANHALHEARALLSHLPPDDQALLTLVHLQGLSMEEAGELFGWSRAKTKIKAFRARQSLRKILRRHGPLNE